MKTRLLLAAVLPAALLAACGGDVNKGYGACQMVSGQDVSAIFHAPADDGGNTDAQPDSDGYYGCTWEPQPGYQDPVQQVNIGFEPEADYSHDKAQSNSQPVSGIGNDAFLSPGNSETPEPWLEVHDGPSYFLVQVDINAPPAGPVALADDRKVAEDVIAYLASHR